MNFARIFGRNPAIYFGSTSGKPLDEIPEKQGGTSIEIALRMLEETAREFKGGIAVKTPQGTG